LFFGLSSALAVVVAQDDLEGNAGEHGVVVKEVDAVLAGFVEDDLLEVEDEVAGEEEHVGREFNGEVGFDLGEHVFAVFINEAEAEDGVAFVFVAEDESEGDGAVGVDGGELGGVDGVKGAKDAKFAAVIGRGIAEDGDLDFHGRRVRGIAAGRKGKKSGEEKVMGRISVFNVLVPTLRWARRPRRQARRLSYLLRWEKHPARLPRRD
jgi:hypothetical protein